MKRTYKFQVKYRNRVRININVLIGGAQEFGNTFIFYSVCFACSDDLFCFMGVMLKIIIR